MKNFCTVLVDNSKGRHRYIKNEHGLSLLINKNGKNILFDTGSSTVLKENSKLLNINLNKIDYFVMSHSHYDHCNGLTHIIDEINNKTIYLGKSFFKKKYSKTGQDGIITYLGPNFSKKDLIKNNIKIKKVKDSFKLCENVFLLSNFKTSNEIEKLNENFIIEKKGKFELDTFKDEVVLVIENENDLTLIVGCSHPGILSMIEQTNSIFDKPVKTIIGGTHLSKINEERVKLYSQEFKKLGIKTTYLCHCSGTNICKFFDEAKIKQIPLHCGDTFFL